MAATQAGLRLTERHRTHQIALRAVFLAELQRVWPLLDPSRLSETAAAWVNLVIDLIIGYRAQSISASVTYYDQFRTAETGAAPIERDHLLSFMEPVNTQEMRVSLVAAGPARIAQRLRVDEDVEKIQRTALVAVSGAASRHVLNGGRDFLDAAVAKDKTALGWARVTDANPCSFCAVLASRGPVYKTRESAVLTTLRSERGAGQPYHDHCACTAEPVYHRGQEWPGRAREFEALWKTSTKGYGGKDALNAFRRAYRAQGTVSIPAQRIVR